MDHAAVSIQGVREELTNSTGKCAECEDYVNRVLDELNQCKNRIKTLKQQSSTIDQDLKETQKRHVSDRLTKAQTKIRIELNRETELSQLIKEQLQQAQLGLEKAIIQQAKLSELEDEIKNQEQEIECFEEFYAQNRKQIEERNAQNTINHLIEKEIIKRESSATKDELKQKQISNGIEARANTNHLIVESARRHKLTKDTVEAESTRINEKRLDGILRLKDQLKQNRENLKSVEARKNADEQAELEDEEQKFEDLINSGLSEIEAENQMRKEQNSSNRISKRSKFLKKQQEALVPIIEKIHNEEKYIEKRKQINPALFEHNNRDVVDPIQLQSDRIQSQLKRVQDLKKVREVNKIILPGIPKVEKERITEFEFDYDEGDNIAATRLLQAGQKVLIAPEFAGLWSSQDHNDFDPEDDDAIAKADVAVDKKVPIATDFVSKPKKIDFTDFVLDFKNGYTKMIQLTNVSYQISSIRFVSLSIALQDFCTVDFTPSGPLSPGMSTSFKLTFRPALLQPITGCVTFSTPNGQFQVPVHCIPPRVDPIVESEIIDFGKQTVGEVIKREIILRNDGATDGEFTLKLHFEGDSSLIHDGIIDEISITPDTGGPLVAKSSIAVIVTYSPKIPGAVDALVEINVSRSSSKDKKDVGNLHIKKFEIEIKGESVDLPVSLSECEFDVGVCTYGFMYQEQFSVSNSSNTAKVVSFSIPTELQPMIEMFPKTGYVQGKNSMQTHVKFQPDREVIEDLTELETPYYDPETGIIEIPITLKVAGQARPLEMYVFGILTERDLVVEKSFINFGSCTIFESVTHRISVTNPTLLVQEYGFLDLPSYISVRPALGFGAVLPGETLDIELVFSAPKAGEFKFQIVLQTLRNFRATIDCSGIGVHPPLKLSKQYIEFSTPLHDTHRNSFYIVNNHLDGDEFKHPVPRIGTGPVFPTGPISFCFTLPDNCGLIFSPAVGTIQPGESRFITVMCNPTIPESDITNMVRTLHLKSSSEETDSTVSKMNLGGESSTQMKQQVVNRKRSVAQLRRKKSDVATNFKVNKNSKLFWVARDKLSRSFNSSEDTFNIPCFITPGSIVDQTIKADSYSNENCLWLHIRVKRLRPAVVVKNNTGKPAVDFGSAPIGEVEKRTLIVENISDSPVLMKSSLLDPHGPFQLLNPLCEIDPGETHFLLLTFGPSSDKVYHEVLQVHQSSSDSDHDATLNISLMGQGLRPTCQLNFGPDHDSALDLGVVQPDDISEQVMILKNTSLFDIKFRIFLDSETDQLLANNRNGKVLFDCSPSFGTVGMNDEIKLKVRFNPDHGGVFNDVLQLRLFGKEYDQVQLTGMAIRNTVYLANVEYSSIRMGAGVGYSMSDASENATIGEPVLLVVDKEVGVMNSPYIATLDIVAINLAQKRKCDFAITTTDPSIRIDQLPVSITPQQTGSLDSGTRQQITFKFETLPKDPFGGLKIILTGDVVSEYDLIFATKKLDRNISPIPPR